MSNPYENYIKIIDVILRKVEAEPQAKFYRIDAADFPHSYSIEQNREQINFLHKLAKKQIVTKIKPNKMNIPVKPFGQVEIAPSYDIHEPDKKALLKERKRLSNFEESSVKEKTDEKIALYLSADGELHPMTMTKSCKSLKIGSIGLMSN